MKIKTTTTTFQFNCSFHNKHVCRCMHINHEKWRDKQRLIQIMETKRCWFQTFALWIDLNGESNVIQTRIKLVFCSIQLELWLGIKSMGIGHVNKAIQCMWFKHSNDKIERLMFASQPTRLENCWFFFFRHWTWIWNELCV